MVSGVFEGGAKLILSGSSTEKGDLSLLGVRFGGGGGPMAARGQEFFRHYLNDIKLTSQLGIEFSNIKIRDYGDVVPENFDLEAAVRQIRRKVASIISESGDVLVSIGGDHCISYPILRGLADARGSQSSRRGIVWFDAHPDVLDSYSGSKLSHGSGLRRIIEDDLCLPSNVLLVGTRAYDPTECAYIHQNRISEIRSAEFHTNYSSACGKYADWLRDVSGKVDELYVSIDVDVLDPTFFPGTGTPVAGGLSTGCLFFLLSLLPSYVVGFDIVEYAPERDICGQSANVMKWLASEILAKIWKNKINTKI